MEKVKLFHRQLLRSKRLSLLVITLTLTVLAGTILAGCLRLRAGIREQIAGREGESLYEVARWQQQYAGDASEQPLGPITDPGEQFSLILRISQLKGVAAIRLFTPEGAFTNALPATITETTLPAADVAVLKTLRPVSHFYPDADLASLDMLSVLDEHRARVPLLEVNVPLHEGAKGPLAGVAQFIIQGDSIAREYAELDERLWLQGGTAFLVAGGILATALALAFRAVSRQTERLVRANQELVMTAKTSAVGAVTSHLIHGLKNPLSGLQEFVKGHLAGESAGPETEWQDAMATTQRMQTLINGVVRVLEEQQTAANYEISLAELVEIISAKMMPVARSAGVHFYAQARAEGLLGNREANLVILILENLIQNAFQATPEGKAVRLNVASGEGRIECEVQDEGTGLPVEMQTRLFLPCHSTKPGGSGIGLAISKQLAAQLGARLELKSNSAAGCVFRLSFPQAMAAGGRVVTMTTTG